MELRHLRYFVAVAEAGSFVRAARTLNIAQPALSRQILDLERMLGVTLLERLPHGVRVTRAGRQFLADARRMLLAAARATSRARNAPGAADTSLRVGYGELLVYWRELAQAFQQFQTARPKVELVATHMTAPQMRSALREDRIDVTVVGIATWPPRGLDGIRIVDAWFTGALVPAGHASAAGERVRLSDLTDLTWYHAPADATMGGFDCARRAFRERGVTMRHRVSRPGSFAFLPQIAAGKAWCPSDVPLAKVVTAATTSIVYRPFADPPILLWIAALWKKGQRAEAVHDFAQLLADICAPHREPVK